MLSEWQHSLDFYKKLCYNVENKRGDVSVAIKYTKKVVIVINGVHDVYNFINEASKVNGDVLLSRGKFAVDGKSFLGVFAIDPSLGAIVTYPASEKEFEEYISQFVVNKQID